MSIESRVTDRKLPAGSADRHHGFTLIELLVVVAIITVLISVLMPSLRNARESAKAAKCAANARSLSMMVLQYGAENNDFVIPNGEVSTMFPTPWFWKWDWAGSYTVNSPIVSMYGYQLVSKVRACTSGKGVLSPSLCLTGLAERYTKGNDYQWRLTKTINVRNPAAVVLFSETPTTSERSSQSDQYVYYDHLLSLSAPRHYTTNTFSFLDGHAESLRTLPSRGSTTEGPWRYTYVNP